MEDGMPNFDWVTARASCSVVQVFEKLRLEVQADIEIRNTLRGDNSEYQFRLVPDRTRFTVTIDRNSPDRRSITFQLTNKGIQVSDSGGKVFIDATLTLSDDGNCRVKINGQERELWQMRRIALESLFFDTL